MPCHLSRRESYMSYLAENMLLKGIKYIYGINESLNNI